MPKPLPLSFQTTYAELLDQCASDAFNDAFPEDGTFVSKMNAGRKYWYFQLPISQQQKQRYVGAETPELLERIAQHQQAKTTERARRALVSTLVRTAMLPRPLPKLGEIVAALATAGVFRLRGVLVGTVAYQTYPAILGMRLPETSVLTTDVDIAQYTNVSVAVGDATPPMLEVLKTVDASFRPVPHLHRRSVAYAAADGVRVDFLTPNEGKDSDVPRRLPALGTDAEPLRFLDFLIHSPEQAVVLHGGGIYVLVPTPQRYAVHKLIVAQRRVGPGNAKKPKDLAQAQALLDVLVDVRTEELRDAWSDAEARSAKWRGYMLAGLAQIDPTIRDRTLRALGKTRSEIPSLDLTFEPSLARNDFEREAVSFWATANKQRVRCLVSRTVLEDYYDADGLDKDCRLAKFNEHRTEIEALIRAKYLSEPVEEAGLIILKTLDVERLRTKNSRAMKKAAKR